MEDSQKLQFLQCEKERMEHMLKTTENNVDTLKKDIETVEELILDVKGEVNGEQ